MLKHGTHTQIDEKKMHAMMFDNNFAIYIYIYLCFGCQMPLCFAQLSQTVSLAVVVLKCFSKPDKRFLNYSFKLQNDPLISYLLRLGDDQCTRG